MKFLLYIKFGSKENLHVPNVDPTLMLHGIENLQLLWVEVDGVRLEDDSFHKTDTISQFPTYRVF